MLEYEETPVIETPLPQKHTGFLAALGNVILFVVLFALGVGASIILRQYLAQPREEAGTTSTPQTTVVPTPLVSQLVDPMANWNVYQPVSNISIKLPPDILTPICDGPTCASQGTYLPGGTRLTIALRGKGQILPTTAGAIMTDAGGREFAMKEASVSSLPSQEFSGLFAGTTGGGYTFAQIRGVVVHGPEGVSLEVNHFAPTGVNANWDTDDALFDKILETIMFKNTIISTQGALRVILPTTASGQTQ